jgi:hypothetical protein
MREAAEAEIDEFHVPFFIEEHVFRFNVSVTEPAFLEIQ